MATATKIHILIVATQVLGFGLVSASSLTKENDFVPNFGIDTSLFGPPFLGDRCLFWYTKMDFKQDSL